MQKKKVLFKQKGQIDKTSFFHPIDLSWWFFFFLFAVDFLLQRGVQQMRKLFKQIAEATKDEKFMHLVENVVVLVSKVLSVLMVLVILAAVADLGVFLIKELFSRSVLFTTTSLKIFGLFLNILIAIEILENITAYLKDHVLQAELVIVTSLIAVARKIILLDLEKISGTEIIGLAIAILTLSISYFIIRFSNQQKK